MGPKDFTEERLRAFLKEVVHLEQSEFPYAHSLEALRTLEAVIQASLTSVEAIPTGMSQPVVNQRCSVELNQALDYHQLMGFLLRSTNIRNSFEVFRPIVRLSRSLLRAVGVAPDDVRVLLSSEWLYSPHVFSRIPYLKGYVLVGLPATESSNPLILPLAGHELGHTVWAEGKLEVVFRADLVDELVRQLASRWNDLGVAFPFYANVPQKSHSEIALDMFLMEIIREAYRLAASQLEETFCDVLGLRLFGESYLYAFAYLISPGWGEYRDRYYPNTRVRASHLVLASQGFTLNVPNNYVEWFEDLPVGSSALSDVFVVDLADASLASMMAPIVDKVEEVVRVAGVELPAEASAADVRARFDKLVPAEGTKSLGDITNAGWAAYNDSGLWSHLQWDSSRKIEVLKDLVLKSIEIQDIEVITAGVKSGP